MKLNVMKPLKIAALATAVSGSALLAGGAYLRHKNNTVNPDSPVQILQSMSHDLRVADIESEEEAVNNLENLYNALEWDTKSLKSDRRDLQRKKIETDKQYDLEMADNDLERMAIKAYALSRIADNRVLGIVEDTFSK